MKKDYRYIHKKASWPYIETTFIIMPDLKTATKMLKSAKDLYGKNTEFWCTRHNNTLYRLQIQGPKSKAFTVTKKYRTDRINNL